MEFFFLFLSFFFFFFFFFCFISVVAQQDLPKTIFFITADLQCSVNWLCWGGAPMAQPAKDLVLSEFNPWPSTVG